MRPGLLVGVLTALLLRVPSPGMAEVLERLVATVNGEIITQGELHEAVELYMHQIGKMQERPPSEYEKRALERRVLEDLIDKKLMEDFARAKGIEAPEEEVDRAIEDVLARANIDRSQLRAALERDGISYADYRQQIRDQIVKAKMIHREIRARIEITDAQIEGYYLDNPEEFRSEPGYVIRHILLTLGPDAPPERVREVEAEAQRIREEIESGMDFEQAAATHSQDVSAPQGGYLGFFREGDLSSEMEEAVAGLEEGEVSGPVRSPMGIHLIRLDERTSGDIRPLDKVRDTIRERLYEEAAERQFEAWRKELRKNAHIEVLL